MRLVLRLIERKLDGADDAGCILGNEHDASALGDPGAELSPEGFGPAELEWMHEMNGGAALDAIDEHAGELRDRGLGQIDDAPDRRAAVINSLHSAASHSGSLR